MLMGFSGIHAELGVRQGTITQQDYNVLKVHVRDMVCTLQLPSQQYDFLRQSGIEPSDFLSTLAERIGRHAPGH